MTEPEEKPNPEIPAEEGTSSGGETSSANMDEIVTETYDKSLHLSHGAPQLDPPGVSTPSIYDKED